MKKTALTLALLAMTLLQSCLTLEGDVEQVLEDLTSSYYFKFVTDVADKSQAPLDGSLTLDTIHYKCLFNEATDIDTTNVTSTYWQHADSVNITVEGTIISKDMWCHIFTVNDNRINGHTTLHVDYYRRGTTRPWAWSEYCGYDNRLDGNGSQLSERSTIGYY